MKNLKLATLKLTLYCGLLFFSTLCADDPYAPIAVYSEIKDICHPTLDDYRRVQHYLTYGERSIIQRLDDYVSNARNFKIIGDTSDELPQSGSIAVNCDDSDRENCFIIYSSFNKNYPRGLKRLVEYLTKSDFKGHILYRLGGWPNVEEGDLALAHVPYAFKVCSFREAKRLGYKRAYWLDTAILPLVSLNTIFDMIKEKGYFVMANSHMIGPYMDVNAAAAFGISMEETYHIQSCCGGIFGVDFTNKKGAEIVDRWYKAAQNKIAFYSPRSDQNALSVILYQMGISDFVSLDRLAHNRNVINKDSLLLIEREFVNQLSGITK